MEIERYVQMKPSLGVLPSNMNETQFIIESCKKYDMGDNQKYKLFVRDINGSRWSFWLNGYNLDQLIMSLGIETDNWIDHTIKLGTKEVTIKATGENTTALEITEVQ